MLEHMSFLIDGLPCKTISMVGVTTTETDSVLEARWVLATKITKTCKKFYRKHGLPVCRKENLDFLCSSSPVLHCNRSNVKPQVRTSEVTTASITPVPLESLTGLRSPQPPAAAAATTNPVQAATDLSSAFSHLSSSSSLDLSDDSSMAGRGR